MLEKFRAAKQGEIAALKNSQPLPEYHGQRPSFSGALQSSNGLPAVIAEYKRASPSKGLICETVPACMAASEYASSGAAAISILTEEAWFKGKLDYLAQARAAAPAIPILRKDFIFDPVQIRATASTPASALLLIVRMVTRSSLLRDLREEAAKFGIECVVEVFDNQDLSLARDSGAQIIQVNARDLDTLEVDRKACLELIKDNPPRRGEKWIAASGMDSREHLIQAANAGFDSALVGTALMANGQPGHALRKLLEASC